MYEIKKIIMLTHQFKIHIDIKNLTLTNIWFKRVMHVRLIDVGGYRHLSEDFCEKFQN